MCFDEFKLVDYMDIKLKKIDNNFINNYFKDINLKNDIIIVEGLIENNLEKVKSILVEINGIKYSSKLYKEESNNYKFLYMLPINNFVDENNKLNIYAFNNYNKQY